MLYQCTYESLRQRDVAIPCKTWESACKLAAKVSRNGEANLNEAFAKEYSVDYEDGWTTYREVRYYEGELDD